MKILHFAIEDYSRIPGTLVREERRAGHDSTLIVLTEGIKAYGQYDYKLSLPFVGTSPVVRLRNALYADHQKIDNQRRDQARIWEARGLPQKLFFNMRDALWRPKVKDFLKRIDWLNYDVLILDGGAGFLRNGHFVQRFRDAGKKTACIYYGSDFRTRGRIPVIDDGSGQARFTFEFDHTLLDAGLTFLYFPYRPPENIQRLPVRGNQLRIGHAPTNRAAKGSERIIAALKHLARKYPIEIVLIENRPFEEAMRLKAGCDLFIDQIGELGYGVNSLEALAMGIPVAVELKPDFDAFLQPHPFLNIHGATLEADLEKWLNDRPALTASGGSGPSWVAERHNPARISAQILQKLD